MCGSGRTTTHRQPTPPTPNTSTKWPPKIWPTSLFQHYPPCTTRRFMISMFVTVLHHNCLSRPFPADVQMEGQTRQQKKPYLWSSLPGEEALPTKSGCLFGPLTRMKMSRPNVGRMTTINIQLSGQVHCSSGANYALSLGRLTTPLTTQVLMTTYLGTAMAPRYGKCSTMESRPRQHQHFAGTSRMSTSIYGSLNAATSKFLQVA